MVAVSVKLLEETIKHTYVGEDNQSIIYKLRRLTGEDDGYEEYDEEQTL